MVGIRLLDQTEAAILCRCRGALTAVGLEIRTKTGGPAIVTRGGWAPFDGGLNLIDSVIDLQPGGGGAGKKRVAIRAEHGVYLRNVFVRNAGQVVDGQLDGNLGGWIRVAEFATGRETKRRGIPLAAPVYIDRRKIDRPWRKVESGREPPQGLRAAHLWRADFPWWETPGATNVKQAPYRAVGDSFHDDTAAIQRAIDSREIVFLPKGYYRVTRPLTLKPNTKLIGVGQHLSVIMARDPAARDKPEPLVRTADTADADTVIAFVGLRLPLEVPEASTAKRLPVYALDWRCGGSSVFRTVDVHPLRVFGFRGSKAHRGPPLDGPAVRIGGHGGGKWYNYHTMQTWVANTRKARAILVENTVGPLRFYNFEPQGGSGEAVAEIRNAKDVSFFGCKTECEITFMRVSDSARIRVFGHGGIGNPARGGNMYEFRNCRDFEIANLADQVNLKADRPYYGGKHTHLNIDAYSALLDEHADGRLRIPSRQRPILYRVGTP